MNRITAAWRASRKFWIAVAGVGTAWSADVIASAPETITATEWRTLGVGLLIALGVYVVPNSPTGKG